MVERVAPRLRRLDEHAQIFPRRLLPDKFVERLRAQSGIDILGTAGRREQGIGHGLCSGCARILRLGN